MAQLLKCSNHEHYKLVRKWTDLGFYTTVKIPIYKELYPNYENSRENMSYEHMFFDESLAKLAREVSNLPTIIRLGKRIFPGLYKEYTTYKIHYFYKCGYKQYRHFPAVKECIRDILESQCNWEEI